MQIRDYLSISCQAAIKAGALIMRIYNENDLIIQTKEDNSPVTQADMESSELICKMLQSTGFPVISEEISAPEYEIRKHWDYYWLIDPLDGTKEFIKHNDQFTVNIALVEKNKPVLGVIFVPAKNTIYFGVKGLGTWKKVDVSVSWDVMEEIKNKQPLQYERKNESPLIITSRSHLSDDTQAFIQKIEMKYGSVKIKEYGSSEKLCMVADGEADIYPRFGPTMEWDTAAGQVFADNAGVILKSVSGSVLMYNKPDLHNPGFIAYHPEKFHLNDIF